jgi:glutamate racemase
VVAQLPPNLDALVYGCTHYPLLDRWFAESLAPQTERIDPAVAQAAAAQRLIAQLNLTPGASKTTYYTNGNAEQFEAAIRRWTGDETGQVTALVSR